LTNSSSLADLRALSSEAVIRANAQQVAYESAYGQYTYGPVVDGSFVPLQPGQLLAQGRFDKDVRVMVGHNANEGALFTPPYSKWPVHEVYPCESGGVLYTVKPSCAYETSLTSCLHIYSYIRHGPRSTVEDSVSIHTTAID